MSVENVLVGGGAPTRNGFGGNGDPRAMISGEMSRAEPDIFPHLLWT